MSRATLLLPAMLVVVLGVLPFVTDASAKGRNFEGRTNASSVKKACGGGLQSGNGAFGCTKCDKEGCTDWSCNSSGKGRQGCWVTPVGKTVPGGKGKRGPRVNVTGSKSIGTYRGKSRRVIRRVTRGTRDHRSR